MRTWTWKAASRLGTRTRPVVPVGSGSNLLWLLSLSGTRWWTTSLQTWGYCTLHQSPHTDVTRRRQSHLRLPPPLGSDRAHLSMKWLWTCMETDPASTGLIGDQVDDKVINISLRSLIDLSYCIALQRMVRRIDRRRLMCWIQRCQILCRQWKMTVRWMMIVTPDMLLKRTPPGTW